MPTALAAFVATLPLVVLPGNDNPSALPQSVLLQVGVAFLWILYLAGPRPLHPFAFREFFAPVLALLAWSAVSTLWASDVHASQRLLQRWIAAAGLALLVSSAIRSMIQARRLLSAVFVSSVVVSSLGLFQHLWGFDLVPQAFPPAGTLGNKNVAAEFVVAGLVPGVLLFFTTARAAPLLLLAAALATALAFVVHSGCRAAWMALLAQATAAAALFHLERLRVHWTTARVGAMALGGLFGWTLIAQAPVVPEPFGPGQRVAGAARPLGRLLSGAAEPPPDLSITLAGDLLAERSAVIRLGVWRNTRSMISAAPFLGAGVGNFSVEYPRFSRGGAAEGLAIDQRVDSAHNDYLQFMTEVGLVGSVFAAWAVLALARTAAFATRGASPEIAGIVPFCGLGLLGLMVSATVSPVVNQPAALAAGAAFAGVILSVARLQGSPRPEPCEQHAPGWGRRTALAATAATLVVVAASGLAEIRADRHVLRMAQAESKQDWERVIREGQSARRLDPGRIDPRFLTASALLRTGDPEGAVGLLEEILAVDPHNANALGNLGIAYMTLGDFERARVPLNQLLSLRPDDAVALGLLHSAEWPGESPSAKGVPTR